MEVKAKTMAYFSRKHVLNLKIKTVTIATKNAFSLFVCVCVCVCTGSSKIGAESIKPRCTKLISEEYTILCLSY